MTIKMTPLVNVVAIQRDCDRSTARLLIVTGRVYVDGLIVADPAARVPADTAVRITAPPGFFHVAPVAETPLALDVLERIKKFDYCAQCDAVVDGVFLQDAVVEEIERLRAKVAELEQPRRERVLVTVVVEANREQAPGFGYDPDDWARTAATRVAQMLGCYDPKVVAATWSPAT
jgi:hypothetical protein